MALSACGLREPARRAYDWAPRQPAGRRVVAEEDGRRRRGHRPGTKATRSPTSRSASGTQLLVTRDAAFAVRMWPRCAAPSPACWPCRRSAADRLGAGAPTAARPGTPCLTGCSSIYQSLRCAVALAEFVGSRSPTGNSRPASSGTWWRHHPEAFADKEPVLDGLVLPVLAGPVRGRARRRLAARWPDFVVRASAPAASATSPGSPARKRVSSCSPLDANGDHGGRGAVRRHPAPAGRRRRLLDRVAVREQAHFPSEQQLGPRRR